MEQTVVIEMDSAEIRITADGRVSVIDAIEAVSECYHGRDIWERIKGEHPDILRNFEQYPMEDNAPVMVVDSEGWGKIWMVLAQYLVHPGANSP